MRAEAIAAFVAGVALYLWLGAPWFLLIPLLLVPDVSMVGYLHSPKTGALTYNLVHNWATGLIVLGLGLGLGSFPLAVAGSILIAHVGMDRALGYGLKLQSAFQDTHLGRIGKRSRGPSRRGAPGATCRRCDRGRRGPASVRRRP